jgi:hypothetical protein
MDDVIRHARAVLVTTPVRWSNLVECLSPDVLALPPAPGEWSAVECLQHLIDAERFVLPVRLRAFLAGQEAFPGFNPDEQGSKPAGQTPAELAAEFARLRAETLVLLDKVTVSDLGRQARHAELGMVTLGEMLHEWAGHDLMHTVQAERALLQPFLRASGPWRHYFADHDVDLVKHA